MRKPIQILVFPYKIQDKQIKYAVFSRSDLNVWQGIAGGGEDEETPLEAAKRETFEEVGISYDKMYIQLFSHCTIPVEFITGEYTWGPDVYVCTEYAFGVDVGNDELKLSNEHKTFKWLTYDEARKILKWDSNRNALWELNERLKRKLQ